MPFLLLGIIITVVSAIFIRRARQDGDKGGVIGLTTLLLVGIFLILFYGLFFRTLTLNI